MHDDRVLNRLKLRDLRILLAVTQAGSMAKAATHLATSQPAVSRAIADMEAALGVALLERSSQGVEPTPYGRALIRRGVAVFDELRQGLKDIEFISDPTVGEVRVGGTFHTSVGIIAAVIDRMSRTYPRVVFHVVTAPPQELLGELLERNVDLIIQLTFQPFVDEKLDSEILYDDQLVVVAGSNSPWSRRRRVELADLVHENWALAGNQILITKVSEAFRAKGLEPPQATVTGASSHLRDTMLATGRFLTVMPESLLHLSVRLSSLKVLPVKLPATRGRTRIVTLKNRALSPVAQLFIECAREIAKPLARGA